MTPFRTLRDQADDLLRQRNRLPTRHLEREDEIVLAATTFFATNGRSSVTFAGVAAALRITPTTLRRYFTDLDKLFAEILIRHLQAIAKAIAAAPQGPNPHAARQEAYRNATRAPFGLSPTHRLLTQQRFSLPPDLLDPIEQMISSIALLLDPHQPDLALSLLDNPFIDPDHALALLALRPQETPAPAAEPEPAPAPSPRRAKHPHPAPEKHRHPAPRHYPQPHAAQARAGP